MSVNVTDHLNSIPIDDLELSVRTRRMLDVMGVKSIGEFMAFDIEAFRRLKGAGPTSVREVRQIRANLADKGPTREEHLSKMIREINRIMTGSHKLSLRVNKDGFLELHSRII